MNVETMPLMNGTHPPIEEQIYEPLAPQVDSSCIDPECGVITADGEWDEEKEKSIINQNVELFHSYRDCEQRQAIEDWWEWVWKAYMAYRRTRSRTEYNVRECFKQLEVWKANVYELMFSGDEWFHYQAREEGFIAAAEGSTAVMHDAIQRGGSKPQFRQFIENMGMHGISYMHPHWRMFRQTEHKHDQMHADYELDTWERTTSEVEFELPFCECLSPRDVYCHPNIQDCRQSPAVFVVKDASPSDLKTMVRSGILDPQRTMEAVMNSAGGKDGTDRKTQYRGVWDDDDFDSAVSNTTSYRFLVCWTYDGMEYVILNEMYLLRAAKLDGGVIPLHCVANYPQDKMHYGVPELMLIVEQQRMLNDTAEFWFRSNFYTGSPMFKIKHSARTMTEQTQAEPGARFYVDAMDDIEALEVPQTSVLLERAMAFIRSDMQLTTGLTDQLAGASSNANTATEYAGLQQSATKRIAYKVVICEPVLNDIGMSLYNIMAKHNNKSYTVRITGEDGAEAFKDYPPNIFGPNVDVQWKFGAAGGPEVARLWMEVKKLTLADPGVNQQPINDRIFRALGERNVRVFRANSMNAQGDALKQIQQFLVSGILPESKPNDDAMAFLGIFQMFAQTPMFQNMPPPMQQHFLYRLGEYQMKVNMMMQQQAQASMAMTAPPGQKQLPVGQQADDRTEGTFNNAGRGAMQQAKSPGGSNE